MPGFLIVLTFEGAAPSTPPENDPNGDAEPSLWIGVGRDERALSIRSFESRAEADAHLQARVDGAETLPEPDGAIPSVQGIEIVRRQGPGLDGAAVGSYLSAVQSLAHPGYGSEAGRRLDETLAGVESIPGYAGHVRGYNAALPDENWAFVFWSSPPVIDHDRTEEDLHIERYRRVR